RAVGKLAFLHPREKVEVFFNGTIAERAVLAGTVWCAAVFVHVLGRKIAGVGFALLDERNGVFVNLVEVITRIERFDVGRSRFEVRGSARWWKIKVRFPIHRLR